MEERIIELELRSMAQEQTIEELSAVVYEQQRELDQLKTQLKGISQKISEPGVADQKQDLPPHY